MTRILSTTGQPGLLTIMSRPYDDGLVGIFRCRQRVGDRGAFCLAPWALAIGLQEGRLAVECFARASHAIDLLSARGFRSVDLTSDQVDLAVMPTPEWFLERLRPHDLLVDELESLVHDSLPLDTSAMARFLFVSADGQVFWKEQPVAMMSADVDAAPRQLRSVAGRCLLLEHRGLPVDFRTIGSAVLSLPEGSPWTGAMVAVESVWTREEPGAHQVAALFGVGVDLERHYVAVVGRDPLRPDVGVTAFRGADVAAVVSRLEKDGFSYRANKSLTSTQAMLDYLGEIDSEPSTFVWSIVDSGVMNDDAVTDMEMKFGS